jgi:hypothetical protein
MPLVLFVIVQFETLAVGVPVKPNAKTLSLALLDATQLSRLSSAVRPVGGEAVEAKGVIRS